MVTQNETYTSSVVPYSPDILDDLPIDDQLAVEFFRNSTLCQFQTGCPRAQCASGRPAETLEKLEEHIMLPCLSTNTTSLP